MTYLYRSRGRIRRSRYPRLQLVGISLLLLISRAYVSAKQPSSSSLKRSSVSLSPSKSSSATSLKTGSSSDATQVLQIVETEVYDGRKWKAGKERWTLSETGQACASPDKLEAPNQAEFTETWKIVTGEARDAHGWEYTRSMPHPVRRRIWLRKYQIVAKKKRRKLPKLLSAIRDDWNFKGFGWTFYKSLLTANSFGVAFRLPLTYNLDTFERRPALPSLSSSLCIYHPAQAIFFLNASLRTEWIQWVGSQMVAWTLFTVQWIVCLWLRGLLLAVSALLFPITRSLYQPAWTKVDRPKSTGAAYSPTIEERLGLSVSWRVSVERGYEFRVSYWHYYAPTLSSILQALQQTRLLQSLVPTIPSWMPRRSAAIGLSTAAPMPDMPYVSCSAILSLSGYYFHHEKKDLVEDWMLASEDTSANVPSKNANSTTATKLLALEKLSEKKRTRNALNSQLTS